MSMFEALKKMYDATAAIRVFTHLGPIANSFCLVGKPVCDFISLNDNYFSMNIEINKITA